MHLVDAQQARRVLDRLVGYTISPVLWEKVRRGTSAGRVQSVALRLVVDREREILAFVPVEYWTIEAELSKRPTGDREHVFRAKLVKIGAEKADLRNEGSAQAVLRALDGAAYKVVEIRKKQTRRNPSAPFTTSTLQQEASRKLGWAAKQTMAVAQQLYEGVQLGSEGQIGLITYMRTDSVAVSAEAQREAREFVAGVWGDRYLPATPPMYKAKTKNAQEAHEAIRPTGVKHTPKGIRRFLTKEQDRLYTLIWRRFVASQMAPALVDQTAADIATGRNGKRLPYLFRATASLLTFPGFIEVYREGLDDDQKDELDDKQLPPLSDQELLDLLQLLPEQHWTEPPHRCTEATLVKALEEKGIGRPSTYAAIMTTISERGYVERDGKHLRPSDLGCTVTDLLVAHFPDVVDTNFTAQMEAQLDDVASGARRWEPVVANFYRPLERRVQEAKTKIQGVRPEAKSTGDMCPDCGKGLAIREGKYGEFVACSGYPACKYVKRVVTGSGVKCPECGQGELVERYSKATKRNFWGCDRYPDCAYATNGKPVDGPCLACGGLRTEREGRSVSCVRCDPPSRGEVKGEGSGSPKATTGAKRKRGNGSRKPSVGSRGTGLPSRSRTTS